jgi:hypothetical protein
MRAKLIRMQIDKQWLRFHPGNKPDNRPDMIELWKCPHCLLPTNRAKCLATCLQYGYEFDDHVDYFRCKCGWLYYAHYLVFTGEETALNERDTLS